MSAALLRPVDVRDLALLCAHRRRMWEEIGVLAPGADDPSAASYEAWLRARIGREVIGWVAERDGEPLGSGLLWFQQVQPRPRVPDGVIPYLLSLFVQPAARRAGLARAITEEAVAHARARGHRRVGLHASDAGRPLYDAMGFTPSGELWLDL